MGVSARLSGGAVRRSPTHCLLTPSLLLAPASTHLRPLCSVTIVDTVVLPDRNAEPLFEEALIESTVAYFCADVKQLLIGGE